MPLSRRTWRKRVPGATAEVLRQGLFSKTGEEGLSIFATYLFNHNASIAIMCFALGFAFGVPSLMLLVQTPRCWGHCCGSITEPGWITRLPAGLPCTARQNCSRS